MPQRLYTAYQVAELLRATPGTVLEWIRKGWLPVQPVGDGAVRVSETGLLQFLRQRGVDIEELMAKTVAAEAAATPPAEERARPVRPAIAPRPAEVPAPQPTAAPEPPAEPSAPAEQALAELAERHRSTGAAGVDEIAEGALDVETAEPHAPPGPEAPEAEAPAPAAWRGAQGLGAGAAAQVAEAILADAVRSGATAIHLEPTADGLDLRLRIGGVLRGKPNFRRLLPPDLTEAVGAGLRALAGGAVRRVEGRWVSLRAASCPTACGEKLVVHLSAVGGALPELSSLGMPPEAERAVRAMLGEPSGLILVAAPPRHGLRETLRAMAGAARPGGRSISAVAEGDEWDVEGMTRVVVGAGRTAVEVVRAAAGADADVIVVDELCSAEEAAAALAAASGGALVIAGLRAASAAEAVAAMLEARADRWRLASALLGAVAQRRVRALCVECRRQVAPSRELLLRAGFAPGQVAGPVWQGKGCPRCGQSGYAGLVGVFSVLRAGGTMAAALRSAEGLADVERAARGTSAISLRAAAAEMVRAGVTSLEEIARVLPP